MNNELSPRPKQPLERGQEVREAADELYAALPEAGLSDSGDGPKAFGGPSAQESGEIGSREAEPAQAETGDSDAQSPDGDNTHEEDAPSDSSRRKKTRSKKSKTPALVPVHSWFVTLMCMNIPLIGWIYLFILAFSSKGPKKEFARAYILYKLVFLILALAILAVAFHYGMLFLDRVLAYMEML